MDGGEGVARKGEGTKKRSDKVEREQEHNVWLYLVDRIGAFNSTLRFPRRPSSGF